MTRGFNPTIDFGDAPVVGDFVGDQHSFVKLITGPLGSAKSTGCTTKLMSIACVQDIDPRTKTRRSRFAIIRNTGPELKTTTIKTWLERWPEEHCGPMRYSAPITHHVRVPPRNGKPGLDAEFLFIALDEPKDVAKLRSLDITAAWVNEASETPPAIVDMLTSRVGRFPPRDDELGIEARQACIIMDTNAPDENHYLVKLEEERPHGWAFYKQPPAVLECELVSGKLKVIERGYRGTFAKSLGIYAAGTWWVVNPDAENVSHLIRGYYERLISGKKRDWIERYLQVKNVFVRDGKPVVPNFHETTHVREDLPLIKGSALILGADIGGGTLAPAALIAQRNSRGGFLIHDEVVASDMGVDNFGKLINARIADRFAPEVGPVKLRGWGDPAAVGKDEIYEVAVFDHLRKAGLPFQPASSNDIHVRIAAWVDSLDRMVDGVPYVLIAKRCVTLRAALGGKWSYKRLQVVGEERFSETPSKNHPYSDVGDAGSYLLMGEGAVRQMRRGENQAPPIAEGTVISPLSFDVFKS